MTNLNLDYSNGKHKQLIFSALQHTSFKLNDLTEILFHNNLLVRETDNIKINGTDKF